MATIEKRGRSYRIRASTGYTVDKKQVRPSITWTPPEGMTEKQADKEAQRQGILFDEQVRNNTFRDNRIKLAAFVEIFMRDFGDLNLKAKSRQSYEENLKKINAALGHIRLCDLTPGAINSFYRNLQEKGIRTSTTAVCKIGLAAKLKSTGLSLSRFGDLCGLSRYTVKAAILGERISKDSAKKISKALDMKVKDVFTLEENTEPLAPATVVTYHRTLSAVLAKAVKWGYLENNPADRAEKPKLGRQEAPYLDEGDARHLLELLQDEPIKWRALITFDLLSGLRRGELLGLRWSDVDIDSQIIRVRQTSNYLPGRGVYVDTPKSDTSRRPLKLSRSAMLLLLEYKQWQDAQKAVWKDAWRDQDGRIFTLDDGRPIFPDTVTKWFTAFVRRSGLPKVTVHSLRHTYASLMISDGAPLVVVSHQLGHAQTSTTANIYAHVIAAAEVKEQETMDQRFNDLVVPAGVTEEKKKAAGG